MDGCEGHRFCGCHDCDLSVCCTVGKDMMACRDVRNYGHNADCTHDSDKFEGKNKGAPEEASISCIIKHIYHHVVSISKFKGKFQPFEAQRQLMHDHALFLATD
jgi:hypothetical protein